MKITRKDSSKLVPHSTLKVGTTFYYLNFYYVVVENYIFEKSPARLYLNISTNNITNLAGEHYNALVEVVDAELVIN